MKGTAMDAMRNSELLAVRDELQAKAVAERTLVIYGGELRRLDEWLDGAPLTDESLALYLCALHGEGKSASTIGTVVAAAKFRAKNEELPCPVGAQATEIASGIRREAATRAGCGRRTPSAGSRPSAWRGLPSARARRMGCAMQR